MVARWHHTSLTALPNELHFVIAGHLAATSERPMDDLHSLRATCSYMRCICGDHDVGLCVSLDRVRCGIRSWKDSINYYALLASLKALGNPEACFLTGIQIAFDANHSPQPCLDDLIRAADIGHNVSAYVAALLLYRHNGGDRDDATARRYIRRIEGEEESLAAAAGGGGPTSTWLRNDGCVLCHRAAAVVLLQMGSWVKLSLPPPGQVRGDLPCAGGDCGRVDGWEGRSVYCSENCRLWHEIELFQLEIGIRYWN